MACAGQLVDRRPATSPAAFGASPSPRAPDVPVLVAELFDGERSVNWSGGRRRIAGSSPVCSSSPRVGVARAKGQATIYNPTYQIAPPSELRPDARRDPPATPEQQQPPRRSNKLIRHRLSTALALARLGRDALPTVASSPSGAGARTASGRVVRCRVAVVSPSSHVQRQSLQARPGAVFATAIAAFCDAQRQAEDPSDGMLISGGYLLGTVFSTSCDGPSSASSSERETPGGDDPFAGAATGHGPVCSRLSWVLVALYAVRLSIQVPLYLAEQVTALGVAKIVLGWPLWIAGVAVMGWLLMRGSTPREIDPDLVADDPQGPAQSSST